MKTQNNNKKNRFSKLKHFVLSGFLMLLVIAPIFVLQACIYIPTYLIAYDYEFTLEDNYIIWNEQEGRTIYREDGTSIFMRFFYSVFVFNSGYDPLKERVAANPQGVQWWAESGESGLDNQRAFNHVGRMHLDALGLTNGKNVIRIISEKRRSESWNCRRFSGRNIRYVGFFEVYVERNYIDSRYEFIINQNLSLGFNGQQEQYAIYLENSDSDGFYFILADCGASSIYLDRLPLLEGVNRIKAERVLSSSLNNATLTLNTALSIFEFNLAFNNIYENFNFVTAIRYGVDLVFYSQQNSRYRVYIYQYDINEKKFLRHVVGGTFSNRMSTSLNGIGQKGQNTLRFVRRVESTYDQGVLTIANRVGEWSFELALNNYSPSGVIAVAERLSFESWDSRRNRWVAQYEWTVIVTAPYVISRIDTNGSQWTFNFANQNVATIRNESFSRGHNIIRVDSFYSYNLNSNRLVRTRRYNYIHVYLNRNGTINIL